MSHANRAPALNTRAVRRTLLTGIALLMCTALQSCFTTGLWASGLRPREKAVLTPLSVTMDALTFPFQIAAVNGDGYHRHHFHDCAPPRHHRGRRCR
ncbi:MAG: hypothetical protein KDC87_17390 [Planctomycetes bacterium]|nr:hypothetical protein [Planctomycetota bacterium]MCB9872058.1 hypothetical protein [Planctomycetota bacterium]MCB9889781.1 hypothetical protein [Planctomycetota bacterium]